MTYAIWHKNHCKETAAVAERPFTPLTSVNHDSTKNLKKIIQYGQTPNQLQIDTNLSKIHNIKYEASLQIKTVICNPWEIMWNRSQQRYRQKIHCWAMDLENKNIITVVLSSANKCSQNNVLLENIAE